MPLLRPHCGDAPGRDSNPDDLEARTLTKRLPHLPVPPHLPNHHTSLFIRSFSNNDMNIHVREWQQKEIQV